MKRGPRVYFESLYLGRPPWDIGRPQRTVELLEEGGRVGPAVLDVGCGLGDNALYLAGKGHEVWAVDGVAAVIERARARARAPDLRVRFEVADALDLSGLGRTFDTVLDSGLFHVLTDEERPRYARSLSGVLHPGGSCFVLCISDHELNAAGMRRVSRKDLRAAFKGGWRIQSIEETSYETNLHPVGARAWIASVLRVDSRKKA